MIMCSTHTLAGVSRDWLSRTRRLGARVALGILLASATGPTSPLPAQTASPQVGASEVRVETLVYGEAPADSAPGGTRELMLDLYRPADTTSTARPGVILVHGGGFVGGRRDLAENREIGQALASRGYTVASIDYRVLSDQPVLSPWARNYAARVGALEDPVVQAMIARHGPDWPDAVGAAAEDLVRAIGWARREGPSYGIDRKSIAVFGMSAGAVTANTLAYQLHEFGASDQNISAVVSVRGALLDSAPGLAGDPADAPPLFIVHGTEDERLRLSEAIQLYETSKAVGLTVEFHPIEGVGHELGGADMLETRLRDGSLLIERLDGFLRPALEEPTSLPSAVCLGTGAGCPESEKSRSEGAKEAALSAREEIIARAQALLTSVDDGRTVAEDLFDYVRAEELLLDFDSPARRDWSYWPRTRSGLALGRMTADQRVQAQDLLAGVLSARGYLKVAHIMHLERLLEERETLGFPRGAEHYTVSIFGRPEDGAPWGWRFEGHHVSLNVTVVSGEMSVTPSFLGASPAIRRRGPHAGFRPLRYERELARRLFLSLGTDQARAALLADTAPGDVLASQFRKNRDRWDEWRLLLQPDGIPVAGFDPRQRALLERLLDQVVGVYRPETAASYRKRIHLDSLWFAWMGSQERGAPQYYRIQGPSFIFEFDASQEEGDHVHTVWRDRRNDFGEDLLRRHYRAHSH